MNWEYVSVGPETIERLWPEAESRPDEAWIHVSCRLIVTNRADHAPLGMYPCPSPDKHAEIVTIKEPE